MQPIRVAAMMEASTITGPAKNLLQFARGARPQVDVFIMTFLRGKQTDNVFLQAARQEGVDVEVIREGFAYDPRVLPQIAAILARRKPDIVQTHGIKSHLLVSMLGRRPPWIAYHHGYTAENRKVALYNRVNRWSLRRANRVVTVCQPFAAALAAIDGVSPENIRVLGNSISVPSLPASSELAALRASLGLDPHEPVILTVGRMSAEKGHGDLLKALSLSGNQAWPLVVVGDGLLREELEHQARQLGIRVIWVGQQKSVTPYYALASLFVLPSWSEGSPNVLLEAMGAGLPVISTQVGGVPEIVRDGIEALLVPPRDPAALAAAIRSLREDPALAARFAAAGRERVRLFTPDAYRDGLIAIYRELT